MREIWEHWIVRATCDLRKSVRKGGKDALACTRSVTPWLEAPDLGATRASPSHLKRPRPADGHVTRRTGGKTMTRRVRRLKKLIKTGRRVNEFPSNLGRVAHKLMGDLIQDQTKLGDAG